MKQIKIALAFAAVAVSTLLGGCAVHTITTGDSGEVRCVVIQYPGGKEIGRWNLNTLPGELDGGPAFKSGDTTIVVRGDIRILYLP